MIERFYGVLNSSNSNAYPFGKNSKSLIKRLKKTPTLLRIGVFNAQFNPKIRLDWDTPD